MTGSSLRYRRDIDGLRAIAVLAVLGFHGFPDIFPGGFVGVDAFFVISGYLITGIIRADIDGARFSLLRFYGRRIRRIFPALLLVLAATLVIGWNMLLPGEFQRLGAHVLAGAGFVSNFLLWNESGYFDTDAKLKPLLHLWSLGIEEQFYIVWPLLLVLATLRRFGNKAYLLTALITGASFVLNLYLVSESPTGAFYSPLGRAWELGVGALLALAPVHWRFQQEGESADVNPVSGGRRQRTICAWLGLASIVIGVFGVDRYMPYPGPLALLPTLGTAAILWAGPSTWLSSRLLGHRFLVGIGLISYPLYLWHWPLLAFEQIANPRGVAIFDIAALLVCSFVLAWVTYRLVEIPVRTQKLSPLKLVYAMLAIGIVATLCALGALRPWSSGRGLEKIIAVESEEMFPGHQLQPFGYNSQIFYREGIGRQTTAYIGDSTMQQYFLRVDSLLRQQKTPARKAVFATMPGCAPIPGVEAKKTRRYCGTFARDAAMFAHDPDVDIVVIGARWQYYFSNDNGITNYVFNEGTGRYPLGPNSEGSRRAAAALGEWVATLVSAGKVVYVMLDAPFGDELSPANLVRRSPWGGFDVRPAFINREEFRRGTDTATRAVRAAATENGATIIDPASTLCDAGQCAALTADKSPIYKDSIHLRATFIRDHVNYIDATLAR